LRLAVTLIIIVIAVFLAPSLTADANEAGIALRTPIKEQIAIVIPKLAIKQSEEAQTIKAGADASSPVPQNAVTITNAIAPTPNPIIIAGETYPFAEQDLFEAIQKHIEINKEQIEARLKSEQAKAREKINSYKPKDLTSYLPRAKEHRTFYPDLTYAVPEDIKDARGIVIYPKGYKFNPIDYVWLKTSYVVIDATDREQIEWLKQSGYLNKPQYQIWLSNGSWSETASDLNQSVYYVNQAITDRFKLERVPSVIRQTTDRKTNYAVIEIKEICVDCNDSSVSAQPRKEKPKRELQKSK
jgi:conjugal transfer pilus assembly protein TraW